MQKFCSITCYSRMNRADHFVSSSHACLKTKWINPGAVSKTCDPSFCVSMFLLDTVFFYRTTSSTSQLRNQETNCFKIAKNSRGTPDFYSRVNRVILDFYNAGGNKSSVNMASKITLCPLFLFQLAKIRLKRKSAKTPKKKATSSAKGTKGSNNNPQQKHKDKGF